MNESNAKRRMLALGALLLASCTYYTPPVDYPAPRWTHKGVQQPARFERVAEVVRAALPCQLRNDAWSGSITWVDGPMNCDGVKAAGCWDGIVAFGAPIFRISSGSLVGPDAADGALIHELGHYGWLKCGKDSQPDFKACAKQKIAVEDCPHPKWFIDWVETTRKAARSTKE